MTEGFSRRTQLHKVSKFMGIVKVIKTSRRWVGEIRNTSNILFIIHE
jgi:hypothetical protein